MNGRQEYQELIEGKIKNKLKSKPQYLIDYSRTFGDKTVCTKNLYIIYILLLDFFKIIGTFLRFEEPY